MIVGYVEIGRIVSFTFKIALLSITVAGLLLSTPALGQRNCATVEYNKNKNLRPGFEDKGDFEDWITQQRLFNVFKQQIGPLSVFRTKATIDKIPVVIHLIHDGENIGVGGNISDTQINSQILVLNEDFRKLNADTTETQPPFRPVATDSEVEFVLAKQDPEGLPTNGIVRVKGSRSSWTFSSDTQLKAESYWPAEDYLNIWVTNLSGGYLGWAQFPVSSLEGLEEASTNRLTDGIVIGYQYFGSIEKEPDAFLVSPWNLGRTTTHEVGHFLGLRHIWGDGDCNVDDFVADTPLASIESLGCPATKSTCGTLDMFQNYMDYTDDACMNLFTNGQKERIKIVMQESPRRASLLTSPGLLEPSVADLDLGIRNIIDPISGICTADVTPSITLRNYGIDVVTNFELELWINNSLIETMAEITNLNHLDTLDVSFNTITTPSSGLADFEYRITEVNFTSDGNPLNDIKSAQIFIPEFLAIPFTEPFDSFPVSWEIKNADNSNTWRLAKSPSWNPGNKSMALDFRKGSNPGEEDILSMPVVDLSTLTEAYLQFDYAYSYTTNGEDRLKIAGSANCGISYNQVIFNKSGKGLETAPESDLEFIPGSRLDWKREVINLGIFLGEPSLQLAFIGTSDLGNTLYLDNVSIVNESHYNAGIKGILSPDLAFCEEAITPEIVVENLGTETIDNVQINYRTEGQNFSSKSFSNLALAAGKSASLVLDEIAIPGSTTLSILLVTPGITVSSTQNTNQIFPLIKHCSEQIIPLRENFENEILDGSSWLSFESDSAESWIITETFSYGKAANIKNYNYLYPGTRSYLISPLLDLTSITKASMFFDVSYGTDRLPGESLRIFVSSDNGLNYSEILYEKSGLELSVFPAIAPWTPQSESDWINEFIDLSQYTGSKIFLAFEVISKSSNDLFIDNIEFFADDNPDPIRIESNLRYYPNPASGGVFNVTFNLKTKEDVTIIMIDAMGRQVFRREYPNTLNQTYPFDMSGRGSGIYILKTISKSINSSVRLFVDP